MLVNLKVDHQVQSPNEIGLILITAFGLGDFAVFATMFACAVFTDAAKVAGGEGGVIVSLFALGVCPEDFDL